VDSLLIERRLDDIAAGSTMNQSMNQSMQITVRPAKKTTLSSSEALEASSQRERPLIQQKSKDGALQKGHRNVNNSAHMVREKHHQPAPTPRAVATQSYNKVTPQTQDFMAEDAVPEASQDSKPIVSGKGMDRLREIARMLDKSGR
jgi:hypothetical protein